MHGQKKCWLVTCLFHIISISHFPYDTSNGHFPSHLASDFQISSFHGTLLNFVSIAFFTSLWQLCIQYQHYSLNFMCSLHVPVSCFINYHNISNFFIIITSVIVISYLDVTTTIALESYWDHIDNKLVNVCVVTFPHTRSSLSLFLLLDLIIPSHKIVIRVDLLTTLQ
jgi:hypothetical protein